MFTQKKQYTMLEMSWNFPVKEDLEELDQIQFNAITLDGHLIFQHAKVNIYFRTDETTYINLY